MCFLEKKHTFYIINDKWSKNKVQSSIILKKLAQISVLLNMLRLLFRSNLTQVPYEICWGFFLVNQIGKYIIINKQKNPN